MKQFGTLIMMVCCIVLMVFSENSSARQNEDDCKNIKKHSGKFAYLANENYKKISDESLSLGILSATPNYQDFFLSKPFFVVSAPKTLSVLPFCNLAVCSYSEKIKTQCKNVSIFKVVFGVNPLKFGAGKFTEEQPLTLLDKEGFPISIDGPNKLTGEIKFPWLELSRENKSVSAIMLDQKSHDESTLDIINSGNLPINIDEWKPESTKSWIKVIDNKCSGRELKPGEVCHVKVKWDNSKKWENYYSWRAAVKNESRSIQLMVEKYDNSYSFGIINH